MDELTSTVKGGELNSWGSAQTAVIGSMMIDAACIGDVMQVTTPEMFHGGWRTVYETVRRLWIERQTVDPVIVDNACGGSHGEAIAEAMRITPTAANVMEYCALLRRCLRLSQYRQAAMDLLSAATLEQSDAIWQRLGRELMGAE